MIEQNFKEAEQLINQAQHILFTTHEKTDGDDLGSVLSIAQHCHKQGKKISIIVTGGVPHLIKFLPFSEYVTDTTTLPENIDLVVVSGCSKLSRINNIAIENIKVPIINIDHHPDNQFYGQVNIVGAQKSSVAELVYDMFHFLNWEVDSKIATCLLTGIVTDTGLFMHSNTQASTLDVASKLVGKGAPMSSIIRQTFTTQNLNILQIWGMALQNMHLNPDKEFIYSVITEQQLNELEKSDEPSFEGIVETLNKVPQAKYAMFIREDNGRVKGSLRSDPYKGVDVSKIAHQLGGGGHKWAAGFSMAGRLVKNDEGKWRVLP
jgi:bifunctional oligoribonuclease and PAP phosphatase NrnA